MAFQGGLCTWAQTVGAGTDSQPPRILDLRLSTDDYSRVFVQWRTSEFATWEMDWGETLPLPHTTSSGTPGVFHHVMLEGLTGATVRIELRVSDAFGNTSPLLAMGFDPLQIPVDDQPPQLVELRVEDQPADDTALISWETDEPVFANLEVGFSPETSTPAYSEPTLTRLHATLLTSLLNAAQYNYRVTLTDVFGNTNSTVDRQFLHASSHGQRIHPQRRVWYPLVIDLPGPVVSETDSSPNPFLDYRLSAVFIAPSGGRHYVGGYFDGDGEGHGTGNVWRVKFTPDEEGTWRYIAQFVEGPSVAISLNPQEGTHLEASGALGELEVEPLDPAAPGFHKYGRLEYVGEHYLKHRDGPYFIKTGTDSPENFLGYEGFDNTFDQGGHPTGLPDGLHRYASHVSDFGPLAHGGLGDELDPLFESEDTGVDSRGIIGAINYLSSIGVNALFFMPMNLGGDGQETSPFIGYDNNPYNDTHYDISKLYQWGQVLDHATRRGLLLHIVLAETEHANRIWLDNGLLGTERRLFFREMVARFGHALGLTWNLSEENAFSNGSTITFADLLRKFDPYNHPIGFHTTTLPVDSQSGQYNAVLGNEDFSMNSIQSNIADVGNHVEFWRANTASSGHKWMISVDEITTGLTDVNAPTHRRQALYDVLFSGGNIEFYFGSYSPPLGGDLSVEDFRTRGEMWLYLERARTLLEGLPFWEMNPADHLVVGEIPFIDGGGAEVFAKENEVYAVYFPSSEQCGTLDLTQATGSFTKSWWLPETGDFEGPVETVQGGQLVHLGDPPFFSTTDWVCLIRR